MNTDDDKVRDRLEDNVKNLLSRAEPRLTMSEADKSRIVSALLSSRAEAGPTFTLIIRKGQDMFTKSGKPRSVAAAVAAIALLVSILFLSNGGPVVQAGEIMQRLGEQLREDTLLNVKVESLRIGASKFTGTLQVSPRGAAGDIEYRYDFETAGLGEPALSNLERLDARHISRRAPEMAVEALVSFVVTDESRWVLIRDVTTPDARTQSLVDEFLSIDGEVLIPFSAREAQDSSLSFDIGGLCRELRALRSQRVVELVRLVLDAHSEYDASVEEQQDGTVVLTLPIDGGETLRSLSGLAGEPTDTTHISIQHSSEEGCDTDELEREARMMAGADDVEIHIDESECVAEFDKITDDPSYWQQHVLAGSTLTVVYDPSSTRVTAFDIRNLGSTACRVHVTLEEGDVAATLLDAGQVMTPSTRIADLEALESLMIELERVWDETD